MLERAGVFGARKRSVTHAGVFPSGAIFLRANELEAKLGVDTSGRLRRSLSIGGGTLACRVVKRLADCSPQISSLLGVRFQHAFILTCAWAPRSPYVGPTASTMTASSSASEENRLFLDDAAFNDADAWFPFARRFLAA